ncbi:hypothetical protein [Janibacter melonis]|uniref:hypothetical protein n=1 Tax=Janibacter melonis TaxID=262209 RepID=UPI00191905D2|nr:hypothetical protein [Janibacter melonis]
MKLWQAYGVAVLAAMVWLAVVTLTVTRWLDLPSGLESAVVVVPGVFIVTSVTRALRRDEPEDGEL